MEILFRKYYTEQHDYLVIDTENTKFDLTAKNVSVICSRLTGFGADYLLCGPTYDGLEHHFLCFAADGTPVNEHQDQDMHRVCHRAMQDAGHLKGMELDTEGVHFVGSMILGHEFINRNGIQDQIPT